MAETGTVTLVEFLRARMVEREAVARAALADMDPQEQLDPIYVGDDPWPSHEAFAALLTPARVLREVEALRAIVDEHDNVNDGDCGTCVIGLWGYPTHGGSRPQRWPCPTLRALATIYADHPDYQREWAP